MKQFRCPTRIICGTGSVSALKDMGIRRLLLVTDPFFVKNGTAERIATLSGAAEVEIFDRVAPDPSVALAAEGSAVVNAFKPDLIVALGGGSAMDCAKAMAYFGGGARLVAIPTTSGSGSEVTDFAILTHGGVKHPLVDEKLRPETAILDDELLKELPASLVADTGFDVLAHAAEAFVGRDASAVTDALAADAFDRAFMLLPASFAGRKDVRLEIHEAATMAGMAFTQAGLGLCHALAHSLGGVFHVPHGRLNAVLLPAVIGCNSAFAVEKYAELARRAGLGAGADSMAVRNLRNALVRLRRDLKMPETLAQAGVEAGKVRKMTEQIVTAAMEDPCCETNPGKVEPHMIRQILTEVTGRG